MNCKQGDLAIIVRSYAGNEGKIVKCIRFVGRSIDPTDWDDDFWEVDALLNTSQFGVIRHAETNLCPDCLMRPLRGDLLNDEITNSKELESV